MKASWANIQAAMLSNLFVRECMLKYTVVDNKKQAMEIMEVWQRGSDSCNKRSHSLSRIRTHGLKQSIKQPSKMTRVL